MSRGIPSEARQGRALFLEVLTSFSFFYTLAIAGNFSCCRYTRSTRPARVLLRILRRFGLLRKDTLKRLTYADFLGSYYESQELTYRSVNDLLFERHTSNIYIRLALSFCPDPLSMLALKKELFNRYTQHRVRTCVFLRRLLLEYSGVVFLPTDAGEILEYMPFAGDISGRYSIPGFLISWNSLRRDVWAVATYIGVPIILGALALSYLFRGITFRRPGKQRFRFGYDVQSNGLLRERGLDPETGKYFLYDDASLRPSEILHVVRDGQQLEPGARALFEERGIPYLELSSLRVPAGFFTRRILRGLFARMSLDSLRFIRETRETIFLAPALSVMKMALDAELHQEYFETKVFIARDDYSPFHIMRTMAARRRGNRTAGFQWAEYYHHCYSYNFFVFDVFALWGEFYRSFHAKGLTESNPAIIGTGIYSLDLILGRPAADLVPKAYQEMKKKYKVIAIMGSGYTTFDHFTREAAVRFYRDVLEVTDQYGDLFRVIKPKGDLMDEEIGALMKTRDRVSLEKEMWTYRFLPVPDLIVVMSVSSLIIESLMIGQKVLSYSFVTPKENNIYGGYSPLLVAYTKEELGKAIHDILNEGKYVDEGTLSRIRELHGYRYDGQVVERFRQLCRDLAGEEQA